MFTVRIKPKWNVNKLIEQISNSSTKVRIKPKWNVNQGAYKNSYSSKPLE